MATRTYVVFIAPLAAVLVAGCHGPNSARRSDASAVDPFASTIDRDLSSREFKEGDDIPLWEAGDTTEARDRSALSPVERRLLAIAIPVVDFRSAHVSDVFAMLDSSIKKHGNAMERDDETRVRIKFIGSPDWTHPDRSSCPMLLTTQYRKMPVYEALRLFCLVAKKVYTIEGRIVTVKDRPKANNPILSTPDGSPDG